MQSSSGPPGTSSEDAFDGGGPYVSLRVKAGHFHDQTKARLRCGGRTGICFEGALRDVAQSGERRDVRILEDWSSLERDQRPVFRRERAKRSEMARSSFHDRDLKEWQPTLRGSQGGVTPIMRAAGRTKRDLVARTD